MRRGGIALVIAVGVLAQGHGAGVAAADSSPHELSFSPARDWTLLGVGLALNVGLKLGFANKNVGCRWCDYDGDRDALNGLDRAGRRLRWHDTGRAATVSDVTLVATPLLAGTALVWMGQREGMPGNESLQDVVIMGQAAVFAGAVTQVAKVAVRRNRPYAHARGAGVADDTAEDSLSFFSGHASTTFAFATSAATVATLRGYDAAPWMWTGVALAGATGYLRVAADKHYLTDVLVGSVVGTAVGIGVTYLLHGREPGNGEATDTLSATVGGGAQNDATVFSVTGTF